MPHLFTNRHKLSDLTRDTPNLRDDFRWETANAILYKVGGFLFIVGSVFFRDLRRIRISVPGSSSSARFSTWW